MKLTKKIIQYGSLIIGTILFVLTLRYIGIDNFISSLTIKQPSSFIIYLIVSFMIFCGFVLRWNLILKSHGYTIPFWKLFNYRVSGFAISYLTPSARLGGEPIRTYFLVKDKVPFGKAMSSVFIDKSLELTANAVMTVIGALVFAFLVVLTPSLKWMLILLILFTILVLWIFYSRVISGKGIFTSIIKSLGLKRFEFFEKNFYKIRESELEMNNFFVNHKRVFIASTIISFVLWILSVVEYRTLLQAFGFTASFVEVFLVLVVVGIAYLVPIPTALGVLESAQVSLFSFFGKAASFGLSVSIVTRIRDMLWTLYGLTYLYLKGVIVNNLLKDTNKQVEVNEKVVYFKKWKIK